jgi:type II secretory pathway pseudopilin PulG
MSTTPHPGALPLDYQSPQSQKRRRPNWLLRVVVTIALIAGGISVLLPSLCRSSETANKARCASNLHQIGLAISMYADNHGGRYPDSFAALLENEQLSPAVFVCPSSNDEAADGADTAAAAANPTSAVRRLEPRWR